MSDTRRRRKSDNSGASDDLSQSFEELKTPLDVQKSQTPDVQRDSEYDTAGSDAESDGGSQDGVQRESGDGQEEDKPQKKLDDDEDRRNPQYIPKRGTFYEHDDRTTEEVTENAVEPPTERETKEKKVWKDKEDRWNHDRYNDDEQAPKSHDELIAVYGYDIRNEEGPPRARRRRRYGRGPNKYTRNWEDEDAYGKTAGSNVTSKSNRRSNKTGEEFPALGGSKDAPDAVDEPVISSAWYSNKNKPQNKQNFPPLQSQDNQKTKTPSVINNLTNENKAPNEVTNPAWKRETKQTVQSSNGNNALQSEIDKPQMHVKSTAPIHGNKRQESVSLAANKARGRGFKPTVNNNLVTNRAGDSKPKGRGSGVITGDPRRNNVAQLDDDSQHEMKHMNVQEGSAYHAGRQQNKNFYARPSAAQPRMQPPSSQQPQLQQQQQQQPQNHQQPPDAAGSRPKRYSSLRQRPSIPDGPGQPQYPAQHGFYSAQGGNSHGVLESQGFPAGHFEPAAPVAAAQPPLTAASVIPLTTAGQPAPYAPPPFLVPPPQFIATQPAPPIINYVPAPTGPTFQPNYQAYPGFNPAPQGPPPPPELYQPQGCTYYNPAQQPPPLPQAPPVRRPKAAIPILPPPDNSQHYLAARGRGRTILQPPLDVLPGEIHPAMEPEVYNELADDPSAVEEDEQVPQDAEEPVAKHDDELEDTVVVVHEETLPVLPEIHQEALVVAEDVVAEEIVAEDVAAEDIVAEDVVAEDVVAEDIVAEDVVADSAPTVIEETLDIADSTPVVELDADKSDTMTDLTAHDILATTKTIEIEAKVTIDEPEVSKVDNVVNQSPVVEEAAA